ncbi:hypothetical protein HMPREF0663_11740 [Hoylesella oralis ATCC 33269]|uniref:Uncharacterized protein n=1 Tax=Hoylesella oralis ATCC 33269 TaxID=873533 RepID=E7RRD9_9BACT|nr:hypothetical protein HMPREF0663_11740 [Hoylesella oralis ATCC 33269]
MIAGRLKDALMYNSRMREVCTFLSVSPIFTLTNIVIKMICCKILGIKKRLWPVFVCDRDMWGRPPPAPPKEGSALRKSDKYTSLQSSPKYIFPLQEGGREVPRISFQGEEYDVVFLLATF